MKRAAWALPILMLASRGAFADPKTECVAASEKAQQLRDDHKLLEAREQFLACSRDACPAAVKKDCTDHITELDKKTPSVVFRVKDKSGQDVITVHLTSDGRVLTEQLDGRAIPLDPGVHTFRFETAGNDPVEQKIVLAEGEQNREVLAQIGQPGAQGGQGGVVVTPVTPVKHGVPVGAFIVMGIGVVSMAVVAPIFYAMGLSQDSADKAVGGCAPPNGPGCSNDEVNSIQSKLIVGDVFMFGGAAVLAGGIIWTIIHYTSGAKTESAAARFIPSIAPTIFGRGAVASTTIRW